jgi:hypothetical protein
MQAARNLPLSSGDARRQVDLCMENTWKRKNLTEVNVICKLSIW